MGKATHVSRAGELGYIFSCVADAKCCAIVGLSNMGKSVLLRSVRAAALGGFEQIRADDYAFIYIDFNLMVEMTEQAFYELILRSTRAALSGSNARVRERTEEAYCKIVDSSNPFLIPLGFNEGVMALCEELGIRVILLFDEFDGPFAKLAPRVFLNLRALKDRYDQQLCYVVATGKHLGNMRLGNEIGEFCEMFAHQTLYLGPLNKVDTRQLVQELMAQHSLNPTEEDYGFVWEQTGGHPGLVEAVCHVLGAAGGGDGGVGYSLIRDKLDSDLNVRSECVKLWNGLEEEQRGIVMAFVSGEKIGRARLVPLLRSGILREGNQIEGNQIGGNQIEVFGARFSGFVHRQRLVRSPYPPGVRVDVDSGEVWVDGRRTPPLTNLEFRLLLLLYGRMSKICDKYQIVEAVWGAGYIDQVDDARIEKLVSRLRKKIEPDPNDVRYMQTVRGRGYRLVEG